MKKLLHTIALITTFALILAMAAFVISILVFLIQGNLTAAAGSFYNLMGALLTLVIVAVLSEQHSN